MRLTLGPAEPEMCPKRSAKSLTCKASVSQGVSRAWPLNSQHLSTFLGVLLGSPLFPDVALHLPDQGACFGNDRPGVSLFDLTPALNLIVSGGHAICGPFRFPPSQNLHAAVG